MNERFVFRIVYIPNFVGKIHVASWDLESSVQILQPLVSKIVTGSCNIPVLPVHVANQEGQYKEKKNSEEGEGYETAS